MSKLLVCVFCSRICVLKIIINLFHFKVGHNCRGLKSCNAWTRCACGSVQWWHPIINGSSVGIIFTRRRYSLSNFVCVGPVVLYSHHSSPLKKQRVFCSVHNALSIVYTTSNSINSCFSRTIISKQKTIFFS